MPKPNAVKALDIYKLFTRETDGLIQVIEISRRFAKSDLPELQHVIDRISFLKIAFSYLTNSNANYRHPLL